MQLTDPPKIPASQQTKESACQHNQEQWMQNSRCLWFACLHAKQKSSLIYSMWWKNQVNECPNTGAESLLRLYEIPHLQLSSWSAELYQLGWDANYQLIFLEIGGFWSLFHLIKRNFIKRKERSSIITKQANLCITNHKVKEHNIDMCACVYINMYAWIQMQKHADISVSLYIFISVAFAIC